MKFDPPRAPGGRSQFQSLAMVLLGFKNPSIGSHTSHGKKSALTSLIIGADNTTNAHVAAAFAHNQLRWLELSVLPDLTFGLGDAVVGTQTAAVLRKLVIDYCDHFRAADVLSLVRACPKLTELEWRRSDPSEWSD